MFVVNFDVLAQTNDFLLDANEGNPGLHTSQTIYFSNINENKISDRETPLELLSLKQLGTEPLLMVFISIMRYSEL